VNAVADAIADEKDMKVEEQEGTAEQIETASKKDE